LKCRDCPLMYIESNESTYPPEEHCSLGDDNVWWSDNMMEAYCHRSQKTVEKYAEEMRKNIVHF
jgi:hypothetical protein